MKRCERIKDYLNAITEEPLLNIWNEYARVKYGEGLIYRMGDIDKILEAQSASGLFDHLYYGDFRSDDEYFVIKGGGNLESFNWIELLDRISINDIARFVDEEENDLGNIALAMILSDEREVQTMKRYEMIKEYLDNMSKDNLLYIWNEYCQQDYCEQEIYSMDDINDVLEGQSASWLFDRMYYGDFRPCDDYFIFNGYGNLESFNYNDLLDYIYTSDIARYVDEEENDLGDVGLAEILTNE